MPFELAVYLMILLGCDIPIIEAIDRCIFEAVQPLIPISNFGSFIYIHRLRIDNWSNGCTIRKSKYSYNFSVWRENSYLVTH